MKRLELNIQKIKAVFVSHEHTDHISGLRVLSKKYQLPVYITQSTLRYGGCKLETSLITSFKANEPVVIGNLSVTAFSKVHDAADPYSFIVCCNQIKVGVFTDIGIACKNVITHFQQCHAAFLETNYDDTMLEQGRYPYFLKTRIRGGMGHLSNMQALELFKKYRPSFMSHLFLSHLSENNNHPDLVHQLFNQHANGVKMIIAPRYEETRVYHICNTTARAFISNHKRRISTAQLAFQFE